MEASGTDPEENQNVVAGTSTGVAANTASSLAPQMMSQLFKKQPLVSPLVLPAAGCEPNLSSSSTSPMAVSPTPSTDKTDNRDPLAFYPEDSDMLREDERLKTFAKWPVSFISPAILARNGFYYVGRSDEVRCAFCKVEIMRWQPGDDPAQDHQRWAPQCPFLRRQVGASNVPLTTAINSGRDECGLRGQITASPVRMPGPVHPRHASVAARLRTFADWPRSMRQKPEELAEAGFFYTGQGDKTKCFYCDGGLKDWENDDVPWEQHARWFDRCAFVQLVKGREYVKKVLADAASAEEPKEKESGGAAAPPTSAPAPPPKEETPVEDMKLCKICFSEERNVCFVPCGHVVACAKCALSTDKCPMCRRTFTNAVRLYFS